MKKVIRLGKLTYDGIGLWLTIRSDGDVYLEQVGMPFNLLRQYSSMKSMRKFVGDENDTIVDTEDISLLSNGGGAVVTYYGLKATRATSLDDYNVYYSEWDDELVVVFDGYVIPLIFLKMYDIEDEELYENALDNTCPDNFYKLEVD